MDDPDLVLLVDAEADGLPNTQLFGIGFGQNGSTSNIGACTSPLACAAAAFSSMFCPTPSATSSADETPRQ